MADLNLAILRKCRVEINQGLVPSALRLRNLCPGLGRRVGLVNVIQIARRLLLR